MTETRACTLCGHDLPPRAWRCPTCGARVPRVYPPIVSQLGLIAGILVAMVVVWRLFVGERAGALLRYLLE